MRVHPESEDAHRAAQAWTNQRTVEQAAEEGRLLCWTECGHPYVGQKDENPPPELEPPYESDTGPDGQMIRITRDEEVIWERTPDELKTMYPAWQREPEHPARSQLGSQRVHGRLAEIEKGKRKREDEPATRFAETLARASLEEKRKAEDDLFDDEKTPNPGKEEQLQQLREVLHRCVTTKDIALPLNAR